MLLNEEVRVVYLQRRLEIELLTVLSTTTTGRIWWSTLLVKLVGFTNR